MKIDRTGSKGSVTVTVTPENPSEVVFLSQSSLTELCKQYEVKIGDTLKFGKSNWSAEEVVKRVGESSFSTDL